MKISYTLSNGPQSAQINLRPHIHPITGLEEPGVHEQYENKCNSVSLSCEDWSNNSPDHWKKPEYSKFSFYKGMLLIHIHLSQALQCLRVVGDLSKCTRNIEASILCQKGYFHLAQVGENIQQYIPDAWRVQIKDTFPPFGSKEPTDKSFPKEARERTFRLIPWEKIKWCFSGEKKNVFESPLVCGYLESVLPELERFNDFLSRLVDLEERGLRPNDNDLIAGSLLAFDKVSKLDRYWRDRRTASRILDLLSVLQNKEEGLNGSNELVGFARVRVIQGVGDSVKIFSPEIRRYLNIPPTFFGIITFLRDVLSHPGEFKVSDLVDSVINDNSELLFKCIQELASLKKAILKWPVSFDHVKLLYEDMLPPVSVVHSHGQLQVLLIKLIPCFIPPEKLEAVRAEITHSEKISGQINQIVEGISPDSDVNQLTQNFSGLCLQNSVKSKRQKVAIKKIQSSVQNPSELAINQLSECLRKTLRIGEESWESKLFKLYGIANEQEWTDAEWKYFVRRYNEQKALPSEVSFLGAVDAVIKVLERIKKIVGFTHKDATRTNISRIREHHSNPTNPVTSFAITFLLATVREECKVILGNSDLRLTVARVDALKKLITRGNRTLHMPEYSLNLEHTISIEKSFLDFLHGGLIFGEDMDILGVGGVPNGVHTELGVLDQLRKHLDSKSSKRTRDEGIVWEPVEGVGELFVQSMMATTLAARRNFCGQIVNKFIKHSNKRKRLG